MALPTAKPEGAEAAEPADADADRSVPKNPEAAGKKNTDGFRLFSEKSGAPLGQHTYFFSSFFRRFFSRFFSFFLRSFSSIARFPLSARR